jgi:hypothetical protein
MLQVFRDLGFAERARFVDGIVRVELDLTSDFTPQRGAPMRPRAPTPMEVT